MAKYRYRPGAKPRTIRFEGTMAEKLAMAMDVGKRLFTQGIGKGWGQERLGGITVPWKNVTAGAEDSAEGMRRLEAVAPGVARGLKNAIAMNRALGAAGTMEHMGLAWVTDGIRVYPISKRAYALSQKAAYKRIRAASAPVMVPGVKVYA